MSKTKTTNISDECDLIENSASEIREKISQISEGSTNFKDVENELLCALDEIKDTAKQIESDFDDLDRRMDEANEKIEELEKGIEELEVEQSNEIGDTTISYSFTNFTDGQIMDALANCLSDSSGVNKINLLNILENLPTSLSHRKIA